MRASRLVLALAAMLLAGTAIADGGTLAERLGELAQAQGFEVVGADRLEGEIRSGAESEDIESALAALLAGHNHIIRRNSNGGIAKIVILGPNPKSDEVPRGIVVATRRLGPHHVVVAQLTGPGGTLHELPLIVDTGATTVVLPSSWIAKLGFRALDLSPGKARTAGGPVDTRIAQLASITVGPATRRNVVVSFIDDARLGGKALLGMSFLRFYRFELDRSSSKR